MNSRIIAGPWSSGFYQPLLDLWANRRLAHALVIANEKSTFHRMFLGLLWKYIEPAFFILTYYIFVMVLRGSSAGSHVSIIAVIISGLTIFTWIQKTLIGSCSIMLSYQGLATTTTIPLVCLIGAEFYQNTRSSEPLLIMTLIIIGFSFRGFDAYIFGLPFILLLLGFCLLPLCIIAAYLGAYFRDMPRVFGLVMRVAVFLSPVLFEMPSVPGKLHTLFWLNPITFFIEASRDVLWRSALPNLWATVAVLIAGIALWQMALLMLQRIGRRVVKVL
jgi:ABC-type polysaccharide/polyol phosphate export permease